MAELVLTNAYVSINAVDLSGKGRTLNFQYSADQQDTTDWGSGGYHERLGGLKDWTVDIEFNQDFAAGSVDATVFPIVGSVVAVGFRPVNATKTATNPEYNGNALVVSYQPFGNSVGEAARARVQLQASGALSRLTS